MKRLARITSIISSLTALLLTSATAALACPPQLGANPRFGPGGSHIKVDGSYFEDGQPVTVRWNSVTGPVLGTGTGPDFLIPVSIPDGAAIASYTIYGIETKSDGSTLVTKVPFRVVAAGATATQGQPAPAPAPATAPAPAQAIAPVPAGAPARAGAPVHSFAPAAQPVQLSVGAQAPAPLPVVAAEAATTAPANAASGLAPSGGPSGDGPSGGAGPTGGSGISRHAPSTVVPQVRAEVFAISLPPAPSPRALSGLAAAVLMLVAGTFIVRRSPPAALMVRA